MPYDEAPSRRMAWDADGVVALVGPFDRGSATSTISSGNRVVLNNESNDYVQFGGGDEPAKYLYFISPELRECDGIFAAYTPSGGAPGAVDTSPDTTNGADGAWTNRIADLANFTNLYANFRNEITSMAVPTQKAIRMVLASSSALQNQRTQGVHIYGRISAGETPDRILFLDTEDSDQEFTKVLDFGDKPRGQTTTRTFKLKNNSSTKTINTIQITAEDLYLNAGDWYTFGDDGVVYQATHDIGNLGPGNTELVYLKQIIPGAETLGLQTARILVSHASVT